MWHDIQHGIFHVDKGILYSFAQLFTRPGHSIREFMDGKRIRHFKPLSLVVILATIYGLLSHYFDIKGLDTVAITTTDPTADQLSFKNNILDWVEKHYALTTLIGLPFYALGSFIAFRKQGYNFIEHLVLNAFLSAQRLFLRIAAFPLLYAFSDTPVSGKLSSALRLVGLLLTIWTYSQFFQRLSKIKTVLLTLLAYAIYMVTLVIVLGMVLGVIGGTMYG